MRQQAAEEKQATTGVARSLATYTIRRMRGRGLPRYSCLGTLAQRRRIQSFPISTFSQYRGHDWRTTEPLPAPRLHDEREIRDYENMMRYKPTARYGSNSIKTFLLLFFFFFF